MDSAKSFGRPKSVRETQGIAKVLALRARRSVHDSRQCARVPEKTGEQTGTEWLERGQPRGRQRAGSQGASPTPADGATLPASQSTG